MNQIWRQVDGCCERSGWQGLGFIVLIRAVLMVYLTQQSVSALKPYRLLGLNMISMPQWQPPRPTEIDKKLRDDFRRLLKEYGITTLETDPILAVLLRSFAAQIAEVYEQAAENIPLAILDELMSGLGLPERRARAAQTVVRFSLVSGRESFEGMTELIGESRSREKLTFALDTPLDVSAARIALVVIYQDGMLRIHHGTEMTKEMRSEE